MSKKLWIAYETPTKTFIDNISIDGCEDVAELLNRFYKRPLPYQQLPILSTLLMERLKLMLENHLFITWKEILEEIHSL